MTIECNNGELRRRLLDEIVALDRLSEKARDSREPVQLDQQSVGRLSRMDSIQQQAMNLANEDRRQYRRVALVNAIKRLNDDNYGYCLNCDDRIAPGRLNIDLAATRCIKCA